MTAKNKNLKFLKEKTEQENISVPDSLSKENIFNLLNEKAADRPPEKKIAHSMRISWKAMISIAACIAVMVSALSLNKYFSGKKDLSASSSGTEFASYDELKEAIENLTKENKDYKYESVKLSLDTDILNETSPSTSYNASQENINKDISSETTYTQVYGVDEGDVIKNDGKYIYVLDCSYSIIKIYEPNKEKADLISTTHITKNDEYYAYDMYLYNNKLIVNADYCTDDYYYIHKTITVIYDISDKTDIKEVQRFTQDGSYISSRIIGNQFYLITNKYVYENNRIEGYAPCKGLDGNSEPIELKDICCIENPQQPSYVIAGSINLDTCDSFTDTKAVLGAGEDIYCSQNNLYVYNSDYSTLTGETNIIKFSLDNGSMKLTAQGKIKGIINDQYSLDEKDDYLRIATTYETSDEYNQLVVLDKDLNEVGKVDDFAKGESVQAVRYMDDTAYVITFEQTDPLFVIDLSDPTSPEIKGEVKITGFSSMLHPIDENTILGVGFANEETEYGEWIEGIKLVLFDISDSSNPKVLDSVVFKNTYSQAQYDPKAFMVNNDKGYYAVPYSEYINWSEIEDYDKYNDDEDYYVNYETVSGAKTFIIQNNKINVTNDFLMNEEYAETDRCTYIGDYIYLIGTDYSESYENMSKIKGYKY